MKTALALFLALSFVALPAAADNNEALATGWQLKAEGRLDEAAAAFERARAAGASPQLVELELGYLAAAKGNADAARAHFEAATQGDDAELAKKGAAELAAMAPAAPPAPDPAPAPTPTPPAPAPSPPPASAPADKDVVANGTKPSRWKADAYADAFGWTRPAGISNGDDLVPTLRLRALFRPVLSIPLDTYVSAQATRDTASHGYGAGGALPQIYADNHATFGAGLRLKLWNRLEMFAQAGPALNLLNDGKDRVLLDVRGGALVFAETSKCAPPPEHGARARFLPCAEVYAEGVYVSRFQNNVMGFARPRVSAGYLVTGPVLWQVVGEGRAAKDVNNDYWNNFADVGAGPRWRLLAPFRLDLLFTANTGTYFGLENRDPAPRRLAYSDLRVLAATYVEF